MAKKINVKRNNILTQYKRKKRNILKKNSKSNWIYHDQYGDIVEDEDIIKQLNEHCESKSVVDLGFVDVEFKIASSPLNIKPKEWKESLEINDIETPDGLIDHCIGQILSAIDDDYSSID